MALFACGINHKTAPISVREKLFFPQSELQKPLSDLTKLEMVREVAILSTCNRTEIYCEASDNENLLNWLRQYSPSINDSQIIYSHQDEQAVRHIMRVACGLDSMMLGEPQILGQMKSAFAAAHRIGTIGPQLQRLFQYVFSTTKQVRTHTGIGANPVSMSYIAVDLAKRIFSDLEKTTAIVFGAGEMPELAIRYLHANRVSKIYIVNRTYMKAATLARKYDAEALPISEFLARLPQADIVITATGAPLPILGKGSLERALKIRKGRPIFVADLAVPRDVEPEAKELKDIYLYCIDDLQKIISANLKDRQHAAEMAEKLIDLQTDHFMRWLRSLDCVSTIRSYRNKMESYRDNEVEKALRELYLGSAPAQIIVDMARNLTNKVMHAPTTQMRQAGYDGQLELLALSRQLFALEAEEN